MHRNLPCLLLLALLPVLLPLTASSAEHPLRVKAGIGYEFLSQEYFLETIEDNSDLDSLDIVTALTTTYLDDVRGQLSVRYRPDRGGSVELGASYEQTPDLFRFRLTSDLRPRLGPARFSWNGELDLRDSFEETDNSGDDYLSGRARAKLVLPITGRSEIWGQLKTDFVRFDSSSEFGFDHHRFGGETGYRLELGGFTQVDASLFYLARTVPDSNSMSYKNLGMEANLFALYDRGDLTLYSLIENKNYDQPEDEDDYLRFEFEGRHKMNLGGSGFTVQELKLEIQDFAANSLSNNSYSRLSLDLLVGLENFSLSSALGPHLELLNMRDEADLTGEDYFETGGKWEFEYLAAGKAFVTLEAILGFRNQYDESDLLSDFVFQRVDLLADWKLLRRVSLNGLLSADWEWHDDSNENNRTYLLSTFLSYEF